MGFFIMLGMYISWISFSIMPSVLPKIFLIDPDPSSLQIAGETPFFTILVQQWHSHCNHFLHLFHWNRSLEYKKVDIVAVPFLFNVKQSGYSSSTIPLFNVKQSGYCSHTIPLFNVKQN